MTERRLKNWLQGYMQYTRDLEAPERVHFWVGVGIIAGALQRKVWIEMPKFDWTCNFYIILVGPPGVIGKSTCMNTGLHLLEKVKGVKFGPESLTWQALGKALQEAQETVLISGDPNAPTGEGAERIPMSCLTIAASELGTLFKLQDDGLASMFINMWDGQRSDRAFKHATIGSSQIEVINPWLNIIGCTTPTWLKINFPEGMIGGGLTSRIIFVYADKKRRFVAYPNREWQGDGEKLLKEDLIHDLEEIGKLRGRFTLTASAMDWGTQWYENVWTKRPAHLASGRFDAYISRKQTALHKIAMILSAAKGADLTITEQLLQEADALLVSNEMDMLRVFDSIGVVTEAKQIGEIAQFLRVHGALPVEELWKLCYNIMKQDDFKQALIAGIDAGQFEKFHDPTHPGSKFSMKLKT